MTSHKGGRNKDRRLRCRDCGKMFSVRTGIDLEESVRSKVLACYALEFTDAYAMTTRAWGTTPAFVLYYSFDDKYVWLEDVRRAAAND